MLDDKAKAKLIQDHIDGLNHIIDVRENLQTQMETSQQQIETTTDENTLYTLNNRISELAKEIDALTTQGQRHMLKIDQLNGVR